MKNAMAIDRVGLGHARPRQVTAGVCLVMLAASLVASTLVISLGQAQTDSALLDPNQLYITTTTTANIISSTLIPSSTELPPVSTILPPPELRPSVTVNIREWSQKLSDDIRAISNRTNCLYKIEHYYAKTEPELLDPVALRDSIINETHILLAQHKAAVSAIVAEAERLAIAHKFNKHLRFNYLDVHRLRNELDPPSAGELAFVPGSTSPDLWNVQTSGTGPGGSSGAQFTSISGGTPVPGPPEWQTPYRSIVMQVNKNFGDIPVNTSMSAVHLPLPIYPGLPDIMNGIAWTEHLDSVFRKNLLQYAHVHHQYYGSHLGFLRTFPAHKWRIQRTEPDLFDARTRPWYSAGASSAKDIVILVDTSGSMTGLRREIAKGVVFEILDTLTANDYFSVMRFAETVTPVGLPKCKLRRPAIGQPAMEELCSGKRSEPIASSTRYACGMFQSQWEMRKQYLRDNPLVVPGKNGSYMSDELYFKSINNVTDDIRDGYLLPANQRNIRYLKSNFSMPTAGIANFTRALMAAFELLQGYNRSQEQSSQCNQAIMLITDGAIRTNEDIFNRFNYPGAPIRVFTYMIGREVGDIRPTKAMACNNRGYYTHVINLSEVREQVQKYLPVLARPMVLGKHHPVTWTQAYGDETHQVLTDWVLETKRRERARIMLKEEQDRLQAEANSSDVINIELTNIGEYDELPLVDEKLRNRLICEDADDDPVQIDQSLQDEIDPLGYNDLACHWSSRRADLLLSVVKPVFYNNLTTIYFERVLHKNIWTEKETHVRNAQLLGVAAVDLRVADIIRYAPAHLLGPNGYAILMGPQGFILHHPDLRALLEDPFDLQSKILKPFFSAVDLSHIEQVYHKQSTLASLSSSSDPPIDPRRTNETAVLRLREDALRRRSNLQGVNINVKRAIDCRRRPHIRQQSFYYGPIKDTPYTLMLALPTNYGLNRVRAQLELTKHSAQHFSPSSYDLWKVHPEFRYCEVPGANSSEDAILDVVDLAKQGLHQQQVNYGDLLATTSHHPASSQQRIVCDQNLFKNLLFDAAATYQPADDFCNLKDMELSCDSDGACERNVHDMRSKLASIYGLEMSFVATRSGLTRVRVFELSARIKKLAELFMQRHAKAIEEPWYARTVDWNMRFQDEATIISVPYNAHVRLIAKLRQRITQRHPAAASSGSRTNCDEAPEEEPAPEVGPERSSESPTEVGADDSSGIAGPSLGAGATLTPSTLQSTQTSSEPSSESPAGDLSDPSPEAAVQNDEPQLNATLEQQQQEQQQAKINYNELSSFELLDLLANSSVHVSATQTVMAHRRSAKQRTPVAVSGLLYDYANFARRFLNATSLSIITEEEPAQPSRELPELVVPQFKVDICPNGQCPQKCGFRNDTIDCLLVDNNGYIVVSEELVHIGRHLNDYDERLMQSLVQRRLFHVVQLTDYQAICPQSSPLSSATQNTPNGSPLPPNNAQFSSSAHKSKNFPVLETLARLSLGLLSNFASFALWFWTELFTLLSFQALAPVLEDLVQGPVEQSIHCQRLGIAEPLSRFAEAQIIANQSLLALLPNKTYLRACEKSQQLYETRPTVQVQNQLQQSKEVSHPEYYVSKCGCSAWYVADLVPKTNLVMLIVNSSLACRRCDQPAAVAQSNLVPVPVSLVPDLQPYQGNRTQEDQVCQMLERDADLFVRRPETCYAQHPDESQIHLCGSAHSFSLARPLLSLLFPLVACIWRTQPAALTVSLS